LKGFITEKVFILVFNSNNNKFIYIYGINGFKFGLCELKTVNLAK